MARPTYGPRANLEGLRTEPRRIPMLAKVFPIKLKDGNQAAAEAIVQEFAPKGPGMARPSAGVAWAGGVDDAAGLNRESAIAALRTICAAVSVPVTADIEAGYGDVAGTVTAVVEAGAVGINLEDSTARVLDDPL